MKSKTSKLKELLKPIVLEIIKESKKPISEAKSANIELPKSNLMVTGYGRDVNGNSILKLQFYDGTNTSIQVTGNLPTTKSILSGNKLSQVSDAEWLQISDEVTDYISKYGSPAAKTKLKRFSK